MGLFRRNAFPVDEVLRRRSRSNRRWNNETYAASALVAATTAALVWANIGGSYEAFWHTPAGVAIGPLSIELTLHGPLDVEEIESNGDPIVSLDGERVPGPINRWRLVESIRAVLSSDEREA